MILQLCVFEFRNADASALVLLVGDSENGFFLKPLALCYNSSYHLVGEQRGQLARQRRTASAGPGHVVDRLQTVFHQVHRSPR